MANEIMIPTNELKEMAKYMGPLFQKKPEDLFALMLIAQGEGLHPAVAAQEYDVIQGRPAINSKAALARFQKAGGSIAWIERTDVKASAKFSHPQGGELTVEWTMDRARQAQLTGKANWQKYPAQMLSARVVAEGVRAVYPACLSGMYTVEEVTDFDDRPIQRDVSPVKEEDNAEKVRRIFGGKEVKKTEVVNASGVVDTVYEDFQDDVPLMASEVAIEAEISAVAGKPGADIKTAILSYILNNATIEAKNTCAAFIKQSHGGAFDSLVAYLNMYLSHPAVDGDAVKYAIESQDSKVMLSTLRNAHAAIGG